MTTSDAAGHREPLPPRQSLEVHGRREPIGSRSGAARHGRGAVRPLACPPVRLRRLLPELGEIDTDELAGVLDPGRPRRRPSGRTWWPTWSPRPTAGRRSAGARANGRRGRPRALPCASRVGRRRARRHRDRARRALRAPGPRPRPPRAARRRRARGRPARRARYPRGDVRGRRRCSARPGATRGASARDPAGGPGDAAARVEVDPGRATATRRRRSGSRSCARTLGVRSVLCEGGPLLLGGLLAAGVLDELFLTVAPGRGRSGRARGGRRAPPCPVPVDLELVWLLEAEGNLLARYAVRGRAGLERA